jgi:ComF family protein
MVYHCINNVLFSLFPPTCLLCGDRGSRKTDLCPSCHRDIPTIHNPCHCCAVPLSGTDAESLCGECQSSTPPYDQIHTPFLFQPPIDTLVTRFKFGRQLPCGALLAALLADHLKKTGVTPPQALLPVPLHRSRLYERGFNQAMELARPLSKQFSIPILHSHVRRIRATQQQARLQRKERLKNLRGCFSLVEPVEYEHLAIIDDVVTTASTVRELASTLKKHGVKRVDVWAVARTP